MGFLRFSLDFPFVATGGGVAVLFDVPDSLSLKPLINDVCDLEKLE